MVVTEFDPVWNDVDRTLPQGQLFMMGFDGTEVTPQIRELIQRYHIGSILLTAKNLQSAEHTTSLVYDLQKTAYDAGHKVPLIIGVDQENGGVNSLFDEIFIRQYPSAMGIAATKSKELAFEVAKATAQEVSACGINLIMGPCLDVLTNARNQPLGVRTTGDDPQQVSDFGIAFMKGYKAAGICTMGKHFPSYGNLEFLGSATDVPIITDSLEQLSLSALIPFRNAISQGIDSMMVGGCAMSSQGLEVMHACLSDQVVDGLLRNDLKFDGVVISECLEMEALSHNIGVGGGTTMAVQAGCDLVLLCRSFSVQQDAISGLKSGMESAMISMSRIRNSLRRVLQMKAKCTSWDKALNPPGIDLLGTLQPSHTSLSTRAYNSSITVVRDKNCYLPLTNVLEPEEELLLLTPLVKPLAASAAARAVIESLAVGSPEPAVWEKSASVMSGEQVFRELGKSLARRRNGRVLHTSYTANGVRPQHEQLIDRASAVIVVTADGNRNLYQTAFAKHVALMIAHGKEEGKQKPLIAVAMSSPYDLLDVTSISSYITTYDFTETAMNSLVGVLCGDILATGSLPGTISQTQRSGPSRQHWLVETFNEDRDAHALDALIKTVVDDASTSQRVELAGASSTSLILHHPDVVESHFVVRNSSTQTLYGFCATYFFKSTGTGVLGALFVDPDRRRLSIGRSLHSRAVSSLLQREGARRFQLGSRLPSIYLGIPTGHSMDRKRLRSWFANLGWNTALARPLCSLVARNLVTLTPPPNLLGELSKSADAVFDLVFGMDYTSSVLDHIKSCGSRPGLAELYSLALRDEKTCGVIRATRQSDGLLIGTIVLHGPGSQLSEYVPATKDISSGGLVGGVSSPVIAPAAAGEYVLLQALVLLGMRWAKKQGFNACVLDCIDGDGRLDLLSPLGFTVLHKFEEVSCDAATFGMQAPRPP